MIVLVIVIEVKIGKSWLEVVISVFYLCQGVFSLIIVILEGLMGVWDFQGIRFLVIGILENINLKRYVFVLEICVLDIIGVEYLWDVEFGELVWIIEKGMVFFYWS